MQYQQENPAPQAAEKPSFFKLLSEVRHIGLIIALLIGGFALLAVLQFIQPEQTPPGDTAVSVSPALSATDMEQRVQQVLSLVEGAGEVRVVIYGQDIPSGVVVVAEGAGDLAVRLELARAVQSLFGIPTAKVEVLPMSTPIDSN